MNTGALLMGTPIQIHAICALPLALACKVIGPTLLPALLDLRHGHAALALPVLSCSLHLPEADAAMQKAAAETAPGERGGAPFPHGTPMLAPFLRAKLCAATMDDLVVS